MKLFIATIAALLVSATLAQAQQCSSGQAVRCTKDFGGGYTCRCSW
jgi:hypothetical protein